MIVGCGGCATVFHTGGKEEIKEMADTLSEKGEEILAVVAPSLTQCAEGLLNGPVGDPRMESVRQILKEIVPGY